MNISIKQNGKTKELKSVGFMELFQGLPINKGANMFGKHFKQMIVLLSVLFISSCVTPRAHFQSKTYKPTKKAVIRYSLSANIFQPDAVQQRRMDARMKMQDFCGSQKPVIISEQKEEKTSGYYTDTSYHDYSNQHSNQYGSVHSNRSSRYGGHRYGGYQTGQSNTYGSSHGNVSSATSGGAHTVSRPIVNTYNIITFECE